MIRPGYDDVQRLLETFSAEPAETDTKERRRRRILQAATELFMQQGYRKTSMDEVARRAGVAKGTVYLYFRTKAELMTQAIVDEKKRYIVKLKPVLEAPSDQRLRKYVEMALVVVNEMPLISKLMSGDREVLLLLEDMEPDLRRQAVQFQTDFVAALLADANPTQRWTRAELLDRARVLLGLIYSFGVLSDERVRNGMSLERFGEILTDIIIEGVGARSTKGVS